MTEVTGALFELVQVREFLGAVARALVALQILEIDQWDHFESLSGRLGESDSRIAATTAATFSGAVPIQMSRSPVERA